MAMEKHRTTTSDLGVGEWGYRQGKLMVSCLPWEQGRTHIPTPPYATFHISHRHPLTERILIGPLIYRPLIQHFRAFENPPFDIMAILQVRNHHFTIHG